MAAHIVKWSLVLTLLGSILYVHLRGKVRHRFSRQLFDHSAIMAPINVFMYAFSRAPTTPFVPVSDFPELRTLQTHWREIRNEALNLREQAIIRAAHNDDDAGFNSFFKSGWKRFYLKWYDASHPSAARYCPRTVEILRGMPAVKAAMFAELPVGAHLHKHRDPYGGSLRYHLGLVTPNSDRCWIEVDGTRYSWRDGQGVIFDETYIHEARNESETDRIILFCDIERPMRFSWAQAINRFLGRTIVTAASSPNQPGDHVGFINRVFSLVSLAGQYRRRFKKWNRTVYRFTKFALIASIVALIALA
jgi:beta-hydroxylase